MKCPECVREGKRSTVTQGTTETLLLYVSIQWDEDGNLEPRPKFSMTRYECSNGHKWTEQHE